MEPTRARPVPFCFHSFLPDPATSCRVLVDAVPRRVRECDTFPMREFADARLTHRRTRNAGDVHSVSRFLGIKFHQPRAGQCRRERAIGDMVPTARPNAGRIAQPALHFICERDCRN